jgi:hypothetical protein
MDALDKLRIIHRNNLTYVYSMLEEENIRGIVDGPPIIPPLRLYRIDDGSISYVAAHTAREAVDVFAGTMIEHGDDAPTEIHIVLADKSRATKDVFLEEGKPVRSMWEQFELQTEPKLFANSNWTY